MNNTLKDMLQACKRSKVAYFDCKRINNIYKGSKFYDGSKTTKHDAQAYLYKLNNKLYITYRGTMDIMDTKDIIDIRHQQFFHTIVHKGFYSQFFSIEEQITNDIKSISESYKIDEIIFTGHSLGGSCALIASPYYKSLFKKRFKIKTYTFGSAAVGDKNFLKFFDQSVDNYLRIENEDDIIPLIPINSNFKHVPNGIILENNGNIIRTTDAKPKDYQKIFKHFLERKDWEEIFRDHSCEVYNKNLLLSEKQSSAYWNSIAE